MADPYQNLAIAIIQQAKDDLNLAKRFLKSDDEEERTAARYVMNDVKEFFGSRFCGVCLGGCGVTLNGNDIYKELGGR